MPPFGDMEQKPPFSQSSSRPKQLPESRRCRQHQSMEPARETSADELLSLMRGNLRWPGSVPRHPRALSPALMPHSARHAEPPEPRTHAK